MVKRYRVEVQAGLLKELETVGNPTKLIYLLIRPNLRIAWKLWQGTALETLVFHELRVFNETRRKLRPLA